MSSPLSAADPLEDSTELEQLRSQLLRHSLYEAVNSVDSLRLFMREHAFAVWDFMSLLKRLQQIVTCCEVPWLPATDASLARFINEIVVAEESDEDGLGGYASHFELYLDAMDEVGADTSPIRQFVERLRRRIPFESALAEVQILPNTAAFVRSTMQLTMHGEPHEVAAAFFHGREDVIPDMFARLVESLPQQGIRVERLVHYLQRHIELDANDHGPLAKKLVLTLCDNQPKREQEATATARQAIAQRISLWDGILAEVQRHRRSGDTTQ
jgi:hypothetical protein